MRDIGQLALYTLGNFIVIHSMRQYGAPLSVAWVVGLVATVLIVIGTKLG